MALTFSDAVFLSLQVALLVFVVLLAFGLFSLRRRRQRDLPRRERSRMLGRYVATRAVAGLIAGATVLILVLAALTVNLHRPPADTTPSIRTVGITGPVSVQLELRDCGDPVTGVVVWPGARSAADPEGPRFARIYSDEDGPKRVAFDRRGRAEFTFSDPTARRGLLSCFLQLPTVSGNRAGATVKLALDEQLAVNTTESAPAPTGYFSGSWLWRCPPSQGCPSLATIEYDVEDGVKQLILLILAAALGAIAALFVSESLVSGITKRRDGRSDD